MSLWDRLLSLGQNALWGAPWCRPAPLALLLLWGWCINLYIAQQAGLPLNAVLGPPTLQAATVLGAVTAATLLWLFAEVAALVLYGWDDSIVYPGWHLVVGVALCLTIILPGQGPDAIVRLGEPARASTRTLLWDIVTSPFAPVGFGHVLLADYATSLAKNFADVFVGACVALSSPTAFRELSIDANDAAEYELQCIHHWSTPWWIALPAVWRMLQCFRRYYEAPKGEHLANALKYSTAYPVLVCSYLKRHPPESPELAAWVLPVWLMAVLINSLYSFWWDVVMDWGLFAGSWPFAPWTIRSKRFFQPAWLYGAVMLVNLAFRVSWSLKLLDVQILGTRLFLPATGGEMTVFVLSVLEVYRRAQWTALRIEWECIKVAPLSVPSPEKQPLMIPLELE